VKTHDDMLRIAAAEAGTKESPAGSNRVKSGEAFGKNEYVWCMMFVWWVFKQAGFHLLKTSSCTELETANKRLTDG